MTIYLTLIIRIAITHFVFVCFRLQLFWKYNYLANCSMLRPNFHFGTQNSMQFLFDFYSKTNTSLFAFICFTAYECQLTSNRCEKKNIIRQKIPLCSCFYFISFRHAKLSCLTILDRWRHSNGAKLCSPTILPD